MPLLINREVVADNWTLINEESLDQAGDVIVPLALYLENKDALEGREGQLAIQVNGDDDLSVVLESLDKFPLIAIDFPAFRDGRGFSIARLLNRAGYKGEIRATGDVGRDRIAYMERCGFTAIQISDEIYRDEMLSAFTEVSNYYQSATDDNRAVYHQ
ncbi:MAG: DUF934 domain-containing protein [Neptuniibacter sp.]